MTGKLKKVLLPNLPYLLFAWLFDKLCQAVRLAPGADASEKLLRIAQGFTEAFASLWLSLHPLSLAPVHCRYGHAVLTEGYLLGMYRVGSENVHLFLYLILSP